jgi:hypothetical protein
MTDLHPTTRPRLDIGATVPSSSLPTDLLAEARTFASRKVLRFLDAASLPPFVAAHRAYQGRPSCPPDRVALFTVTGWDPTAPSAPFAVADDAAGRRALSQYFLEAADPTGWLRMMTNNALCQVSIAVGFRGPNAHFVGGADVLRQAIVVASQNLMQGSADLAIVVAFDPPAGHEHAPPATATTAAAAVSLRVVPAADAVEGDRGGTAGERLLAEVRSRAGVEPSPLTALGALDNGLAALAPTTMGVGRA